MQTVVGGATPTPSTTQVELLDELLPRTCENFRLLCSGAAPSGAQYAGGALVREVVKGVGLLGGVVDAPGGSRSAFAERHFADEGFFVPHAEPGLLTMANAGVDTNGDGRRAGTRRTGRGDHDVDVPRGRVAATPRVPRG